MITVPHAHQVAAFEALRASIAAGHRRPLMQGPTGFGKTVLAAMIVESALAKGRKVLFVVPAVSLVEQTVRAFARENITAVGIIQGSTVADWDQPVQVASLQTLMNRRMPDFDVAIIDEAHRRFRFINKWLTAPEWADKPIIGLSATPWSRGLGQIFDDLIVAATTKELIEHGYLSPFRVFAPSSPDLKGVRTVDTAHGRDFNERDLADAMDKGALTADIISTWLEKADGRPTFVFAVNRVHAKHIEAQFREAGITTGYVDAFTKLEEREQILRHFQSGDIQVLANVGCLTTGIDCDVRCIVLARPTKSIILYCQMIGRGLRLAPGKTDLLLLDHSDSTLRLGTVADIHQAYLDDGQSRGPADLRGEKPLPTKCPSCTFLRPPKTPVCPSCGFKPEPKSKITCEDGELIELGSGKQPKTFTERARRLGYPDRLALFGQLRWHGSRKGYKPGWAKAQFIDLTKTWPDGLHDAQPAPPTPELMSWLQSRRIAYALGRKRGGHGR